MTSNLKSATSITLVSMCILSPTTSEAMRPPNDLGGHMTSDLKSATLITLVYMCILSLTASEASKRPRRSYDLRFEISDLAYPGIHVHIASDGLRGLAASKQPRRSYVTPDLKSATLITPVCMCIFPPRASNGLRGHGGLQTTSGVRSDLKILLSDLNYICYHAFLASTA